jgi:hypothetical protein
MHMGSDPCDVQQARATHREGAAGLSVSVFVVVDGIGYEVDGVSGLRDSAVASSVS